MIKLLYPGERSGDHTFLNERLARHSGSQDATWRKSEMAARGARNSNVQALTDEEHWQIHRQCVLFWERPSGGRDFYQELRRKCEARDPSFAKPKKVKAGKPAATEKKEEGAAA